MVVLFCSQQGIRRLHQHPAPSTQHPAPGTQHSALSQYPASSTHLPAPAHCVLNKMVYQCSSSVRAGGPTVHDSARLVRTGSIGQHASLLQAFSPWQWQWQLAPLTLPHCPTEYTTLLNPTMAIRIIAPTAVQCCCRDLYSAIPYCTTYSWPRPHTILFMSAVGKSQEPSAVAHLDNPTRAQRLDTLDCNGLALGLPQSWDGAATSPLHNSTW